MLRVIRSFEMLIHALDQFSSIWGMLAHSAPFPVLSSALSFLWGQLKSAYLLSTCCMLAIRDSQAIAFPELRANGREFPSWLSG